MKEPTKDDLLALRRVARTLCSSTLRDEDAAPAVARLLNAIADDVDAPQLCEGCDGEAVFADDEGCYTCRLCGGGAFDASS